jgi:hypothetical protein
MRGSLAARGAGFFRDVGRSGMRGALALAGVRTMPWHRGSQHDLLLIRWGALPPLERSLTTESG